MYLKKEQIPVFIVHFLALSAFVYIFIAGGNYEFLIYIGVIVSAMLLILATNKIVDYPVSLLWGLTIWSIMHMSGGGLYFNGVKLYDTMLLNLVGEPYNIFKYDQLVHAIGFGVATLLMFTLMRPLLPKKIKKWTAISVVIVFAGMGAGALNEVIEFGVTVLNSNSGVGGYVNNALDLVFNTLGAIVAMIFIRHREKSFSA